MAEGIRATPYRSSFAGSANDILGGLLGYMRDPRRTQQMQGLAGLLESTGIPKTVERLAYGEPLTNLQKANVPTLRPETAEALMTLLPVPSGASKAARAVDPVVQKYGPRLEQSLLPAFEAAYNRGGLTREMVEAMGTGVQSPLTVYHGSPAKFNKFDRTKIGSGEGAQAYGYGHYVAESPGVAKDYQKSLSGYAADGKRLPSDIGNVISNFDGNVSAAIAERQKQLNKWIDSGADSKHFVIKELKDEIQKLSALQDKKLESTGAFYEIDLPDEQIARMLDFDKPLMEQSKEIQALAKQYGLTDADHMGGDLIAAMDAKRPAGAEAMRQSGVPGIRYLDQQSRGPSKIYNVGSPKADFGPYSPYQSMEDAQQQLELLKKFGIKDAEIQIQEMPQTSNFVVFPGNEDLLTILKRNGGLLD